MLPYLLAALSPRFVASDSRKRPAQAALGCVGRPLLFYRRTRDPSSLASMSCRVPRLSRAICGVARGLVSARAFNNLHLPLVPAPNTYFEHRTYNGHLLRVCNARRLMIPELPKGWLNLPQSFVRCCNFRFGVSRFGYAPTTSVLQ